MDKTGILQVDKRHCLSIIIVAAEDGVQGNELDGTGVKKVW
jgi:hypothetical protein